MGLFTGTFMVLVHGTSVEGLCVFIYIRECRRLAMVVDVLVY